MKSDKGRTVYAVMKDEAGYFVATCYTSGDNSVIELTDNYYIAIFIDRIRAQAYVSLLNGGWA